MKDIVAALGRAIDDGQYAPHSRLPSERELARRFGVPVRTARLAVQVLVQQGKVHRIERGGTFVNAPTETAAPVRQMFPLQCINFVEPVRTQLDPFGFALTDYLHGYTRSLQQHPLRVRFMALPEGEARFEPVLNPALPVEGQGCIIGDLLSRELMEWLNVRGIPYVVRRFGFYDEREYPPHHGVYLNRNGASHRATLHLMQQGHTRIAFLGQIEKETIRSAWNLNWCSCQEGYRAAFCVAGQVPDPRYEAGVPGNSVSHAAQAATRLLELADPPTAFVCQNDLTAFGALKAAHALGLKVPQDVSVIGFDNDPAGADSTPPLTTFGGHEALAVAAIERLFAMADGKRNDFGAQPIECPMILRESTAAPASPAPALSDLAPVAVG